MELGGKNKNKSKIRDWHNPTGSAPDPVTLGGGSLGGT